MFTLHPMNHVAIEHVMVKIIFDLLTLNNLESILIEKTGK